MKKLIFATCLSLGLIAPAFGLAGDLSEPGLAFPEKYPQESRSQITEALKNPECKFLGGRFINWITTLTYEGDARKLSLFMEGLAKVPGVSLTILFRSDSLTEDCDWSVQHTADNPGHLSVSVNLKSPRIKLEELSIPEVKGPPMPAEKK